MDDTPLPLTPEARLRAVTAALAAVEQAERDLQDAVDAARAAGDPEEGIRRALAARDVDVRTAVRELVDALGPAYVAALAGARSREDPAEWADARGALPGPDATRRLLLVHRAWTRVVAARGEDAARAWILRPDPALGGDSPLVAIKRDRVRDLSPAVDALLEDRPDH